MTYQVLLSATFVRRFRKLPAPDQDRIRTALEALGEDPTKKRPGADIKQLVKTKPPKHRIRIGSWRVVYFIEGKKVRVIEVFTRGRGYRE